MTGPVVFDRARLRRMQVLFAVATVPALGVLVVFVVYLVASLVLGGGRMLLAPKEAPQPVPDGCALDAPVGWRSEADPIRFVADVDDRPPAALEVVVGPIGPDVAMPDGTWHPASRDRNVRSHRRDVPVALTAEPSSHD